MINEEILMKNRYGCMLSLLKFNEENISVKELRNKTEVGMADEEKARQKARGYDTEYAEDFMMSDMLSRPQDFDKQSIKDVYLCLKEKHYRDGYLDGLAEGRKEKCFEQNNDGTIRPCEVMKENEELKKDKE